MLLRVLPSLRPKRVREHGVAVPQRVGRKYGVAVGLVVVTVVAEQPTTQRLQQALAAECDTNASRERLVQIVTQTHWGRGATSRTRAQETPCGSGRGGCGTP